MGYSERGSQWRRWDLHIHTPMSIVQDYGGDTPEVWENYISALEALPEDIKVLGINDYMFVDGYEKVLEFKNSGRLQNIDLLLPVIELRIDKLVGSSQLNRINYHVIFSDEVSVAAIRSQFINGLHSMTNLEPDTPDGVSWGGTITPDALTDLGQAIYDSTPDDKKSSDGMRHIGFNNLNVSLDKLRELLRTSTYFKDKHMTAVGQSEWDDFRWDGSPAEKKSLINNVDIIFTASPTSEGAATHVETLKSNGVNCKVIHSSDGHNFCADPHSTKTKDLGHCFTWIKADTTFEGLKQVLYDYDDRVRLQEQSPYDDKVKYVLDAISIKPGGILQGQIIPINRDLISIIGSKGSGKSLLLSAISSISDLDDHGAKTHEIFSDEERTQTIDFDLIDKAGSKQYKYGINLERPDENNHTEPILYVAQEELATRSKQPHKVREEYLRELGISNLSIGYQDIIDDTQYSLNQIDELDQSLAKIAENFEQPTGRAIELKEYLKKKIKNLETTNQKLSNDETRHIIEELSKIIAKGQDAAIWQKNDGFQEISLLASEINEKIAEYNEKAKTFGAKAIDLLPPVDVDKLDATHDQSKRSIAAELAKKRDEYTQKKQELEKLGVSEDIPSLLKTVENIQRDIATHKKALEEVEKIGEAIPKKRSHLSQRFASDAEILSRINERIAEIDTKFTEFKAQRKSSQIFEKLFSCIDVKASIFFNHKKLEADIVESFYSNRLTVESLHQQIFGDKIPTHELYMAWVENEFWSFFDKYYNDLKSQTATRQTGVDRLREIVLIDWHKYVSVSINITHTFGGLDKEIKNMSTGELATVLLKLILVTLGLDKQIILLDQPEDHLDNEFIANDLVDLIRSLKKMRQVVIVTHNANLVVMTDSEQVIVAQGVDNQYLSGGIENPDIRDNIVNILEGGSAAFIKRHRRYGNGNT